jgi:hypothetical protein
MSSPHEANDPPRQPSLRLPDCPRCRTTMRLMRIGPHPRFINLDERSFACVCGAKINDAVARVD